MWTSTIPSMLGTDNKKQPPLSHATTTVNSYVYILNSVKQLWCLADEVVFEMHFQIIFLGFLKLQPYSSLKAICIKTCKFCIQIHCSH